MKVPVAHILIVTGTLLLIEEYVAHGMDPYNLAAVPHYLNYDIEAQQSIVGEPQRKTPTNADIIQLTALGAEFTQGDRHAAIDTIKKLLPCGHHRKLWHGWEALKNKIHLRSAAYSLENLMLVILTAYKIFLTTLIKPSDDINNLFSEYYALLEGYLDENNATFTAEEKETAKKILPPPFVGETPSQNRFKVLQTTLAQKEEYRLTPYRAFKKKLLQNSANQHVSQIIATLIEIEKHLDYTETDDTSNIATAHSPHISPITTEAIVTAASAKSTGKTTPSDVIDQLKQAFTQLAEKLSAMSKQLSGLLSADK